ncbi:hypothetical protein M427DRAFT_50962 [Gonapodya prolifera JEL478]|uniref:Uncharacterized protein n=1 Tax=Gonapodya prolifera (strain JEL478) TaxID=1344416 RepID=A0A139AYK2_GONPJ|nr:hypothetical protein M427DRAFT_50962 [Gonapodya prolifera JEL478]|eukprot:KXS21535.1 hypothetical protein M427DRAFT_50962 [Gonapodya prolifera JEL478]
MKEGRTSSAASFTPSSVRFLLFPLLASWRLKAQGEEVASKDLELGDECDDAQAEQRCSSSYGGLAGVALIGNIIMPG